MTRRLLLAAVLVSLGRAAVAATCSPTTFVTAATYPAPSPQQVVVADFNNDGFPDIATSSGNQGVISVLLNAGDGTFGAPIETQIPYGISQLASADLRGNGTADLVVAVYFGVEVLLGNGNGTFAAAVEYQANQYSPTALVIGTFDANDSPDIVISDAGGSNIDLFPGNGDGTFGTPISSVSANVTALAAGDFNGDAKLDLVSANNQSGTVSFFPGLGNGSFGAPANFIAGPQLGQIAAGDLDGDGKLDVAVTSGAFVSVLLGNGNGTFQAALQYPAGTTPLPLAIADFNQDGVLDVVVLDLANQTVSILFGTGDGSLEPPTSYLLAYPAWGLAVGDLDGDSLPDVVSTKADAVVVILNAGDGSLRAIPESNVLAGPYPNGTQLAIGIGDWNGDGRQDLAWTSGNQIDVIGNLGAGRFAQTQVLNGPPWNPGLNSVAAADFDGDGKQDLVSSGYADIYLFPGLGDGTFGEAVSLYPSAAYGMVAAADFTGDGKADILLASCCGTLQVLPGNGDGTFQAPVTTAISVNVFYVLPADLNGDGKADLVTTSENTVYAWIGNGDGTFQPPTILTTNGACCYTFWIAVGRFSGGPLDVLVAEGNYNSNVLLFPGNGDGTFGTPIQIALDSNSGPLATGDYDGDGNDDFSVLSGNRNIDVFPGLGNRHFQAPTVYPAFSAAALQSGNFTGGGPRDVAAIGSGLVATLVNARLGATVQPVSTLVGSPAILAAAAGGYGPISYQWRKNGAPLTDGGPVSGATTATLTIDPADFADAGSYDVLVADSCTAAASNAATLAVEFADVPPSNIFHADIITIATAGITAGCGGADYCPAALVTRAQMAVFLLKSEHGSAYVPPACAGLFADVPCPSTYADWIEQLSNEGVTAGCGNGDYCPDDSVTRAQMAVFLLKTSQGSGYVPPAATAIFNDVPVDAFAAAFIDDVYTRGIAGGCSASPLLYCPNNAVNRAQMAAFLVNTFF